MDFSIFYFEFINLKNKDMKNWVTVAVSFVLGAASFWIFTRTNKKDHEEEKLAQEEKPKPASKSTTSIRGKIGEIYIDKWVVELLCDDAKFRHLIMDCTGEFYLVDGASRRTSVTNGVCVNFSTSVWTISIPTSNLKDLKNATSALIACKYNRSSGAKQPGHVNIIVKED